MFKVNVQREIGEYPRFEDAFKALFAEVKRILDHISLNAFENSLFIRHAVNGLDCEVYFYVACDIASEVGILTDDGELNNPMPEVDPSVVDRFFLEDRRGKIVATLEPHRRNSPKRNQI